MSERKPTSGEVATMAVFVFLAIVFGVVGACGGVTTISALSDLKNDFAGVVLIVSIPSLLIGGALAVWSVLSIGRILRKRDGDSES